MPTLTPRRVLVLGFLGVLIASAAAAAMWPDRGGEDPTALAGVPRAQVFAGLCASAAAAADDDLPEALGLFLNRAHTGLHEIAADLEAIDERRTSARLLEAKNAVEVSLPARGPTAGTDLRELADATAAGIATLDDTPPPTCTKDTIR